MIRKLYIGQSEDVNKYVNDIIINNTHINRIYKNTDVYWGNTYSQTPTPSHLLWGTTNTSTPFTIKLNNSENVQVTIDNGNWYIDSYSGNTITTLQDLCSTNTSIVTFDGISLDTSQCSNFRGLFYGANNLESVNLANKITSVCTNIMALFMGCTKLKTIDFSGCVITNISSSNQYGAFQNCDALTDIYITEESTLRQLTGNLTGNSRNYIPHQATIHYNGTDYTWVGSSWTATN